jgi:hypothetical protein
MAGSTFSLASFWMQGYHRGISASTTEAVLMDVEDMLDQQLEPHSRLFGAEGDSP